MLNSEPSSVTRMVDSLEKHTFVKREIHPSDRRAKLVVITDKGKKVLERANTAAFDLDNIMDNTFSKEELDMLMSLLTRLIKRHEEYLDASFSCKN